VFAHTSDKNSLSITRALNRRIRCCVRRIVYNTYHGFMAGYPIMHFAVRTLFNVRCRRVDERFLRICFVTVCWLRARTRPANLKHGPVDVSRIPFGFPLGTKLTARDLIFWTPANSPRNNNETYRQESTSKTISVGIISILTSRTEIGILLAKKAIFKL